MDTYCNFSHTLFPSICQAQIHVFSDTLSKEEEKSPAEGILIWRTQVTKYNKFICWMVELMIPLSLGQISESPLLIQAEKKRDTVYSSDIIRSL